uniref:tripartite motif-containing protein 12A-like n=1 Tax=Pristiophorus japonicus TaxID=55135 RepID=UPI00398E79F1
MKTILHSLRQKKTSFDDFEFDQQENISEMTEQSSQSQNLIDSEFYTLRNILDEKEQNLVEELNEEKDDILFRMETNLRVRRRSRGTTRSKNN